MTRIIFSLVLLFAVNAHSQKRLDISLEGYINNFTNKKKIFGATMYMFQDGKMLSKSLSDSKGTYFISGSITTVLPFEILVSKPGYVSKKVLFDFEKLKVRNPNGTLQAMELLIIELFEVREGAVLDFAKDTYAEKFSWDPAMNLAVPEEKYKKDIEDEVLNAYSLADQGSKADLFKTKLTAALKRKDYEVAVTSIDSALIYEPNNTSLAKRKIEIEALIEKIKKDKEARTSFEVFKTKGDKAFSLGQLDEAENNYNSALALIDDNQVKYRLTKIAEARLNKENQLKSNNKLISLRTSADSLHAEKSFAESVLKLKEIQALDPGQRVKIQAEIKAIRKESENYRFSISIEKYIERAQSQNQTDSVDAGLANYKKADMLIKKLSDQQMINTYSSQVESGIAEISSKKNSEEEAFRKQIEKAYSNVLKGRDSYDLASRILDSEPMKARANDARVIALKKQIKSLEEMYTLKDKAFSAKGADKQSALIDLRKAFKIANDNYRILPDDERTQMKDSLSSWSGGADFVNNSKKPEQSASNTGTMVRSPGELHEGSDFEAFNDLSLSIQKRKSDPLKDLQDVKNKIDYEVFFAKTKESVRNEASTKEMQTYMNAMQMNEKAVNNQKLLLQEEQANAKQVLDSELNIKAQTYKQQQELSAFQIEEWKTEKEYQDNIELLNQLVRDESFTERQNTLNNERELIDRTNDIDNTERLAASKSQMLSLDYEVQKREAKEKLAGENRVKELEDLKSSKPEFESQPNYLKDENGILFPSNAMTQRVFKRTNSQGDVVSVTIQRVVVDINGYGSVYEQTTDQNGAASYTRNNASISEHVWFNESKGVDVLKD
ncbi:MAG: hypothetical protein P8P80_02400 [Crocinitomicaceae bacterium]|nr:hypothetical protein [Crocinitomicaceae bacterium]